MNQNLHFSRVALIGVGLIGSSIARLIRRDNIADHISVCARSKESQLKAEELGIADSVTSDPGIAAKNADLVFICTPLQAYKEVAKSIAPVLGEQTIVTDVGSVKTSVIKEVTSIFSKNVRFVPGHPVAGTEHSGPESGFAELFEGRWCILTPSSDSDMAAVEVVMQFWKNAGSQVELMDAEHHDLVLAITSHLPHLIAYNIVGTAEDLEAVTESEVIKYSAGGFRDFTRIAASDPIMWRDIFLANREAVLEMLSRFNEDLARLQRAIRWGDAETLEQLFTRTRQIRRSVIDAGQKETWKIK